MYLTQGLHRAVQQNPDGIATIFGDRVRSFVEQADRVAYLGLNSDWFIEYYLAVPWADAVLNPVNVRWSPAEIAYSLKDSQTRVLLVDDAFIPLLPAIRDRYIELNTLIYVGDAGPPPGMLGYEELVAAGPAVDDVRRGGDALAALFYTGGTTGFPKGVMLSHANLLTSALGSMATGGFGSWERFLYAVPMFHLAGLGAFIGVGLAGGTQVIVPVFDPIAVLAAIEQHRVTDTLLIPIMIQLIVDHPQRAEHDLSSLQLLSYAGSPIALPLLDRARKALPGAGLTQGYGLTECGVISLLLPADHEDDSSRPDRRASGGRAAPHAEVRIVDSEDRELPRGQVGEIVVRGGSTMLGYWGKPEETAIALRGGWMHTGDAGRMDAHGYLSIVDRIRDMIVTGGENVYSAEVENAVATHPAVAKCAVIGVPDEQWGERVHAVVVCTPGAQASEQEIRAHTKTLIAGYKAPRTVEFVETLPVTPIGKVLKRELRAKVLDRH